ncbi:precorrin-3B synthase [Aquamicrobium terrae]
MSAPARRGACPALSAPMPTGDGLLARLNPIAGGFSPNALIGLCESALHHGSGIVEVTARGSVQVRGLTERSAPLLAADVDALGIAVRTGVPVETGPLAGLDPDEIADPRPLAEEIRAALAEAGLAARLGPKVSVIVDGGGRIDLSGIIADVRLAATRARGEVLWHLAVGGDAGTATPLGTLAQADACAAALSILGKVAALGRAGRARDLADAPRIDASIPPSGGIQQEGKAVAVFPLNDGTFALGIALPFGSMPAKTLVALAQQAKGLGAAEIRPAPARALLLPGLSADACRMLREIAGGFGFVTDPADPRLSISACPGASACASGRIATRDIATALAASAPDLLDGSFALHVSGCAKGCAHPGVAALALAGSGDGTALVVNGTAGSPPAAIVANDEARHGLRRIASLVRGARRRQETAAACLARLGATNIATAFAQE